ncbi:hypothetical protein LJR225_002654 [Phenylobacterium sp. LjRoot225]|uniref:hypothetical protein n=1 Tax=Phenylobacterium sp. LjRoot225 TaxID=3342285 RepID=UPI003ED0DB94
MDTARPFSGPISVTLAGLILVALAVASFTASLWRQLDLPRPDRGAKVVVVSSQAPPPAAAPLAVMTPTVAAPVTVPPPRRVRAAPDVAPPVELVAPALAPETDAAVDAAATGDTQLAPPPPAEPAPELVPPY